MKASEEITSFVLGVKRLELYLNNIPISEEDAARIDGLIQKRASGYPLQYILGEAQFIDCRIMLREGIFIPRPETEILVDAVANHLGGEPKFGLDLGTGSGCVAIGLTKYLKNCTITASDISPISIDIASQNVALNGVEGRIEFALADMFDYLDSFSEKKVDFIISNPPYIKTDDLKNLPAELGYEPREALDGGYDGLLYIRRIIETAPGVLKKGGLLALEIGDEQRGDVEAIARKSRSFSKIEFVKDLNKIDRVFLGWTN